MKLKYGMNPYQANAELVDPSGALAVVNGVPSVINILDALNAWQLVRETAAFAGPVAASFKHVSPSGVAAAAQLTDEERAAYYLGSRTLSPLATAYARARGSDRLASFGDFVALSEPCDEPTARLIRSEVCDGIIAPGYNADALEILSKKKNGAFLILGIDPDYEPPEREEREVFGLRIIQDRNSLRVTPEFVSSKHGASAPLSDSTARDAAIGLVTLKYTQSNSICVVHNGQVIGVGAGQQSRILCTDLALSKANRWYQKLKLRNIEVPDGATRTERDQIIEATRASTFGEDMMLPELGGITLCSDGFYPHPDNIEAAARAGVSTIVVSLGSVRDGNILKACERHEITLIDIGVRLFHHG